MCYHPAPGRLAHLLCSGCLSPPQNPLGTSRLPPVSWPARARRPTAVRGCLWHPLPSQGGNSGVGAFEQPQRELCAVCRRRKPCRRSIMPTGPSRRRGHQRTAAMDGPDRRGTEDGHFPPQLLGWGAWGCLQSWGSTCGAGEVGVHTCDVGGRLLAVGGAVAARDILLPRVGRDGATGPPAVPAPREHRPNWPKEKHCSPVLFSPHNPAGEVTTTARGNAQPTKWGVGVQPGESASKLVNKTVFWVL